MWEGIASTGLFQSMNDSKVFSSHEALPSDLERLYWHEWFGKLPPKRASLNRPNGPNKPEESSGSCWRLGAHSTTCGQKSVSAKPGFTLLVLQILGVQMCTLCIRFNRPWNIILTNTKASASNWPIRSDGFYKTLPKPFSVMRFI